MQRAGCVSQRGSRVDEEVVDEVVVVAVCVVVDDVEVVVVCVFLH
ncbi:MAG: hypothetical protein QXF97_07660 [Candidatus Caldarchaeum sp.]